MNLELIATLLFLFFLSYVLYWKRKQIHIEKIFFPVIYFAMLRTGLGLNLMNRLAKRMPRFWRFIGYLGIVIGFLGMAIIVFELFLNFIQMLIAKEAVPGVGLVLPFKAKGVIYVPPLYWIISIFFLALVHEFSHGILARTYDLPLKSSGFAAICIFIPIIPAAFVEPDEEKLFKRPAREQLSVFAAGPLANIITALVVVLIVIFITTPFIKTLNTQDGITITGFDTEKIGFSPAEKAGIKEGEIIKSINNNDIKDYEDLIITFNTTKPGDTIQVATDISTYNIELAPNPRNDSLPYMGIFLDQHTSLKEKYNQIKYLNSILVWIGGNPYKLNFYSQTGLLGWIWILNFGIGLFNLVPLGPIDGGRMYKVALEKIMRKERAHFIWKWTGIIILFILIFSLGAAFF